MDTVLIVIHLMAVVALVVMILLQRSEGGALGIGGGGGGGGFMSSRGTANILTRGTAILAAVFFATSLGLSLLARWDDRPASILDEVPTAAETQSGETDGEGILNQLQGAPSEEAPSGPQVPSAQ